MRVAAMVDYGGDGAGGRADPYAAAGVFEAWQPSVSWSAKAHQGHEGPRDDGHPTIPSW